MFQVPILIALSVAPGLAIGIFIYWRDKFEKEPILIMATCFILGMISILPAIYFENLPDTLGFNENPYSISNTLISSYLFTGFVEEFCKFFFLLLFAYPRKAFSEPYDGITYAVMVSLGFATIENLHYVLKGGIDVALLRMFTAVPAHATFGVLMGYFTGLAKFRNHKKSYLLLGLLVATLFHGTYDFFLLLQIIPGLYLGAIISLVAGILFSIKAIQIHSRIHRMSI
ncbi:MAG: PrsW family glutamic-type intramembrane protease [Bacteroidota bacterium]